MSYCRWSSDNFGCDLYCYEDVAGGWTTHVAGRRHVGEIPSVDWTASPEQIAAAHKAQTDALAASPLEPIGLPHDGATFRDGTLEDFLATLLMLREAGYRFGDYVLDSVREEMAEEVAGP